MRLIITTPSGASIVIPILGLAVSSERVLLYAGLDGQTHRREPGEWVNFQVVSTGWKPERIVTQ